MAAYKKLAHLAYLLHQKTVKGEIDWKETVLNGEYQASFSNYSIQISLVNSQGSPEACVKMSVIGEGGDEIESFTDEDIELQWLSEFESNLSPYVMMHDTYGAARRLAVGAEKAINQILSELVDDVNPW